MTLSHSCMICYCAAAFFVVADIYYKQLMKESMKWEGKYQKSAEQR